MSYRIREAMNCRVVADVLRSAVSIVQVLAPVGPIATCITRSGLECRVVCNMRQANSLSSLLLRVSSRCFG